VSDTQPIDVDYARSSTDENGRPHYPWQLETIAEAVTSRLLTGRLGPVMLLSADYGARILDQESPERAYVGNE
jgi:hypothetical protein